MILEPQKIKSGDGDGVWGGKTHIPLKGMSWPPSGLKTHHPLLSHLNLRPATSLQPLMAPVPILLRPPLLVGSSHQGWESGMCLPSLVTNAEWWKEGRKEGGAGLASFCSNNKKALFSSGSGYQAPFPALHSRKPDFSQLLTSPKGQASSPSVCCCCSCQSGHWGHWTGT